jgi:hypothetical protein
MEAKKKTVKKANLKLNASLEEKYSKKITVNSTTGEIIKK